MIAEYSWDRAAAATLAVYQGLTSKRKPALASLGAQRAN